MSWKLVLSICLLASLNAHADDDTYLDDVQLDDAPTSQAAAVPAAATPSPVGTSLLGRKVLGGWILHGHTANAESQEKALFLCDQGSYRGIAEECGFVPKGARIYKRATGPANAYGRFSCAVYAEVEFEDCERAKHIKDDPEKRKRFENDSVAKDQKLYDDYLRTKMLGTPAVEHPAIADTKSQRTLADVDREKALKKAEKNRKAHEENLAEEAAAAREPAAKKNCKEYPSDVKRMMAFRYDRYVEVAMTKKGYCPFLDQYEN